nr:MAG: hypothetical protein [Microvirus sp.]
MYIVEWLEAHEVFKKTFVTLNEAENFAFRLMQLDLIVISINQSFQEV